MSPFSYLNWAVSKTLCYLFRKMQIPLLKCQGNFRKLQCGKEKLKGLVYLDFLFNFQWNGTLRLRPWWEKGNSLLTMPHASDLNFPTPPQVLPFTSHCTTFPFCFVAIQSLSHVRLFATPWTAAQQVSLTINISLSFLKLTSIELVMPPNHFILCHPLLLLSLIFPSIRVFSNESVINIRWPNYWTFSFSISPSNEYSGLTGLISLLSIRLLRVFSSSTFQKYQYFGVEFSLCSNFHIYKWLLEEA